MKVSHPFGCTGLPAALCVHLNIDTLQTSPIRGFSGGSTTQAWLIKSLAVGEELNLHSFLPPSLWLYHFIYYHLYSVFVS